MKLENNDLLTIYNLENEKVSHKMLKFITQLVLMFAARIIVSFILATIYFGINYSEVQISAELLNIDKNIILLESLVQEGRCARRHPVQLSLA